MSQPSSASAFQRVAIVNRGEPAMRPINAVREWNAEGRPALRVIAVYTAADRRATFVREADEAVLIGPDPNSDADDAGFSASPYLDYAELERALRKCRADAVWPGWGFVSEKAEFAEIAAVEGSYASVIGGAPAAAVVFAAEVNKRTSADPRVSGLQTRIAEATANGDDASRLRAELASAWPAVHSEKLGQVADEFDNVHSIERARDVGSVHTIVPAARLRPYLVDAVQRGMQAYTATSTSAASATPSTSETSQPSA